MRASLPSEPNIREQLARNLSVESSALGLMQEARRYRLAEIHAHEEHLSAAIRGESAWYKDHFDPFDRFKATIQWSASLMNRWLWGYGERAHVLVRNWLLLTFIVFPFIYYIFAGNLKRVDNKPLDMEDYIYFSLENMLPGGFSSGVEALTASGRLLASLESLFGVLATALFAAYVFRWSLHR